MHEFEEFLWLEVDRLELVRELTKSLVQLVMADRRQAVTDTRHRSSASSPRRASQAPVHYNSPLSLQPEATSLLSPSHSLPSSSFETSKQIN